jgi:Middle or third domain of peptidase_M16
MAAFKYISMLRSTDLSPTHQTEVSSLSDIRFRFAEKRRPDNYAVWMTDKLSWPVPRELVVKAPQVVSEWDPDGTAQAVAFQTLKGFSVKNTRTFLMAKQGEFQRLFGTQEWQSEPWYGTQYRVERLDEAFIQEVRYLPLRGQGFRISFSHRQRAQTRSMLFIFLDQTSLFLSGWTSTGGRFHKYASTRLEPAPSESYATSSSPSHVPI